MQAALCSFRAPCRQLMTCCAVPEKTIDQRKESGGMTCTAMEQCFNCVTQLMFKYKEKCFLRGCDAQAIQLKWPLIEPEQKITRHPDFSLLDSPECAANKDKLAGGTRQPRGKRYPYIQSFQCAAEKQLVV